MLLMLYPHRRVMPETPLPPRLASMPAAAASLGVSTKTVWRILRAGKLPCVRIGGRTMVAIADLDVFIASQRGAFVGDAVSPGRRRSRHAAAAAVAAA